jgi:hypothetical protein
MAVNGHSTVKESEAAAIDNKDDDNRFFRRQGYCSSRICPAKAKVNQEIYISVLRRMREALRHRRPDL